MHSGCIIKTPDRLTYAPAVELCYLGEMAELDKVELTNTYIALQSMELALIGAGVGGGIKHTSELKVLNYKKAMCSPDAAEWRKEIKRRKHDSIRTMPLLPSRETHFPKV